MNDRWKRSGDTKAIVVYEGWILDKVTQELLFDQRLKSASAFYTTSAINRAVDLAYKYGVTTSVTTSVESKLLSWLELKSGREVEFFITHGGHTDAVQSVVQAYMYHGFPGNKESPVRCDACGKYLSYDLVMVQWDLNQQKGVAYAYLCEECQESDRPPSWEPRVYRHILRYGEGAFGERVRPGDLEKAVEEWQKSPGEIRGESSQSESIEDWIERNRQERVKKILNPGVYNNVGPNPFGEANTGEINPEMNVSEERLRDFLRNHGMPPEAKFEFPHPSSPHFQDRRGRQLVDWPEEFDKAVTEFRPSWLRVSFAEIRAIYDNLIQRGDTVRWGIRRLETDSLNTVYQIYASFSTIPDWVHGDFVWVAVSGNRLNTTETNLRYLARRDYPREW